MKRRISPWIGRTRDRDGQRFECTAVETVFTRRGLAVPVLRWCSVCAECGEAFTFTTARKPADTALQRRCAEHRVTRRNVRRWRRLGIAVPTPGLLADQVDAPRYDQEASFDC